MNKFIQLTSYPRRFLLNILRFMFCKKNREITLILIAMFLIFSVAEKRAYAGLTFNVPVPTEYNWNINRVDLDKLADCVAIQETAYCTSPNSPTCNSRNNCWGIKSKGSCKHYKTIEDGKKDFKRIWSTYYKGIPTYKKAEIYSGKDKSKAWYYNVMWCYDNN